MIYKNSMKLLTSNFSFVWKQLAYTLIRLAIILGLTVLVSKPILDLLASQGFIDSLATMWGSVYTNTAQVFATSKETINKFFEIIIGNISSIWFYLILFFIVVVVINTFLKNVGKYTLTYVAHSNFTSLNNCGYAHSLVSNLGKICKYSLIKMLLDLPFAAIKVVFLLAYCSVLNNIVLSVVGISLLIIMYTLVYALQIALYHATAVQLISNNIIPFKSIFKTYKKQKDFSKVFSNAIIVVLTIIIANAIFGIFSVGAGLLITIPASMVLTVIFELISFYSITGQRYYLSPTIIVDTNSVSKVENL